MKTKLLIIDDNRSMIEMVREYFQTSSSVEVLLMNNVIKIGLGIMIKDGNKVLLGHRCEKYGDTGGIYEPGSWTFPGGKQEYDETIFEGAIRETKEETNLDISDLEVFLSFPCFYISSFSSLSNTSSTIFTVAFPYTSSFTINTLAFFLSLF